MQLDKLLRLLSNKTRRDILANTETPKTFTEIKNELRTSSPSLARHINSLYKASLVVKNEQEKYQVSQLGSLVLGSLGGLDAVTKHCDYLKSHDVSPIPDELLRQFYALGEAVEVSPTYRIIELLTEKTEPSICFYYDLSDDFPGFLMSRVAEKISEGTEFKAVYPENLLHEKVDSIPRQIMEKTRLRTLETVRLTVVVSDDFAFLGLPIGDHVDRNTYLYGEGMVFRDWCMQLFQHYWLEAREYG